MSISLKRAERLMNRGEVLHANNVKNLSAKYWRYKDIIQRLEIILLENEKRKNTLKR